MIRHIVKREPPAWLLVTAIIFFITLLSASGALWLFDSANKGKVFPGVYVGQLSLGGKSEEEAFTIINEAIDNYRQNGITFAYNGHKQMLPLEIAGESSENSQALIDFNADKMTARALGYGRDADIFTNAFHQLNALFSKHYIAPSYALNETAIKKYLVDSFQKDIQIGEPAKISFADNRFVITPEKPGYSLDFSTVFEPLESLVSRLETGEVTISITKSTPSLTADQLASLIEKANIYLDKAPLNLNYQKKKWAVKREALGNWLAIASDGQNQGISLNKSEVLAYLNKNIAPDIEIKVTDSKFLMKNGKAIAFSTAKDGLLIDATSTLSNIETDWLSNNLSSTSIAMMKVASQTSTTSSNDLGITELIGVGTSNFSGSSANRIHNIRIGMSYLNGLLIPPGETFSVMRHLGTIDGSKGYREELVIKKDKTQKEFGGGLCQVGTTMFRAALNSGLPITERRNHSYRVSYYEPAGTDATIYDPAPDLKFVNDTGNYVLIQGRIAGSKLIFEFWGTKDGRKATQTYPKITNIVKPRPAKLIETLDLKPGQKKCTEKAHNGADASFFYSVTYANGEVKSKTFNSHYVPWQEVCLIGVSKLSPAASSTDTGATVPATSSTTTSTPAIPAIKANATSTSKAETPIAAKEPNAGTAGTQATASSTTN
jgi:vancomycin resistance protein YoaR